MSTYSPKDIYNYIIDNDLEAEFMSSVLLHKRNYTIAEIPDKVFTVSDGKCVLKSKVYSININVEDEEVYTAVHNGLYVSVFISRKDDLYEVHFLVHRYPVSMKSSYEDEIAREVVRYIIMKTIVALRLDTIEKIDEYIS